jgi:hypothetical protein
MVSGYTRGIFTALVTPMPFSVMVCIIPIKEVIALKVKKVEKVKPTGQSWTG